MRNVILRGGVHGCVWAVSMDTRMKKILNDRMSYLMSLSTIQPRYGSFVKRVPRNESGGCPY